MEEKQYGDQVEALLKEIEPHHVLALRNNPVFKLAMLNIGYKVHAAQAKRDNPLIEDRILRHLIGRIEGLNQFEQELSRILQAAENSATDKEALKKAATEREEDPLLKYLE